MMDEQNNNIGKFDWLSWWMDYLNAKLRYNQENNKLTIDSISQKFAMPTSSRVGGKKRKKSRKKRRYRKKSRKRSKSKRKRSRRIKY